MWGLLQASCMSGQQCNTGVTCVALAQIHSFLLLAVYSCSCMATLQQLLQAWQGLWQAALEQSKHTRLQPCEPLAPALLAAFSQPELQNLVGMLQRDYKDLDDQDSWSKPPGGPVHKLPGSMLACLLACSGDCAMTLHDDFE
jgi:hypothetical protein